MACRISFLVTELGRPACLRLGITDLRFKAGRWNTEPTPGGYVTGPKAVGGGGLFHVLWRQCDELRPTFPDATCGCQDVYAAGPFWEPDSKMRPGSASTDAGLSDFGSWPSDKAGSEVGGATTCIGGSSAGSDLGNSTSESVCDASDSRLLSSILSQGRD